MAVTNRPVFHVEPMGLLGGRMFQYLVALSFRRLVPDCRISNVCMPEWGIDHPPLPLRSRIELAGQPHSIEMAGLAQRALAGELATVVFSGFGQRLENFPDLDTCRAAFQPPVVSPVQFDQRYVICHVRAPMETYGPVDPNRPPTPIAFFADVVAQTGLIPVFLGRGMAADYADQLRARFPHGVFLDPGDTVLDFEIIRRARTIAIGVSSFAWLAAWLSQADRIFICVSGRFNPKQERLADLLPFGDPRYRFYLSPIHYAVPLRRQMALLDRIGPLCRHVRQDQLKRLLLESGVFDPPLDQVLELLDPDYYMASYRDVAEQFGADNAAAAARQHYREHGIHELRMPFDLSARWYAERYPMAALEVAQGDYSDFVQHYVAVGRARGYRPLPDADDADAWQDPYLDDVAPPSVPSITVLAREILQVEQAEPLAADTEVALGEGFRTLLAPQDAAWFARREATEAVHIFRLHDVILDVSMMALFNGRYPIRDTLYMMTQWDCEHALVKPLVPEPTNVVQHYIVGGNASVGNYYHWMTQSLPAIDWGLRTRRHPNVALALPPLQPWQEQALGLLGHADVPRLTLRPSTHYALGSAEYAEFLGARMPRMVSRGAAATFERLRRAVAPEAAGGEMIYVARTDATNRVAVNEAALIAVLAGQGVRIVVPGTLPVTQQLAIFRRARLVIGPHGAGLSNMIACEPGTYVYELLPSHYANFCYCCLAQSCRLHYWADVFPGDAANDRWRLNLDVIAARLVQLRARLAVARAPME